MENLMKVEFVIIKATKYEPNSTTNVILKLMKTFEEQIGKLDSKLPVLPILHSCSAFNFRSILADAKLIPSPCDVFVDHDFLYTYYGAPSYRKQFTESTSHPAFFPVCFILKSSELPLPERMYPFDSGAFSKFSEMKNKHFYPEMKLEHFRLNGDLNIATSIVEKYFNSNKNYVLKNVHRRLNDIDPIHFEEYSYVSLLTDESLGKMDSRVATIELIFENAISLSDKTLEQVILPSKFLDSEEIRNDLIRLGIDNPYSYEMVKGNPNEYFGQIFNQYIDHLNANSYLK
jgi:hypothetical protein